MKKTTRKKQPYTIPLLLIVSVFIWGIFQGCSTSQNLQEERAERLSTELSATQTVAPDDTTYEISPGDEIEIVVWERSNFNTITTVSSLGTITIPLVGEMNVNGMTQEELQKELGVRLSEFIKGDVNLTTSIRNTKSRVVSVFGMVNEPDNYPIVSETSIFRILSTAGGPMEAANLRNVKIYHASGEGSSVTLDLTTYLDSGRMDSPALTVYPGDIVYVPSEENAIRELSDFLRDVIIFFGIFRVFN